MLFIILTVIGWCLFIFGIIALASPDSVKGLGIFMLVVGLLMIWGFGGYLIYTTFFAKKSGGNNMSSESSSE